MSLGQKLSASATAQTVPRHGPLCGVDMDDDTDYAALMADPDNALWSARTRKPRRSAFRVPVVPPMTRAEALRSLGSVLYAVRLTDGLIKIGYTTQMHSRVLFYKGCEVLAFKSAVAEDEQPVHDGLRAFVAHGQEYYYPTLAVLQVVNEWRAALGLPDL